MADEPTSMLDVSIRLGILDLLARIKRERDLALLYITHDIATAAHVAEEVIVMFAGQMVEWGDTKAVIGDARHPYTRLLLSAVPDPDRPFVPGDSARFLAHAEEVRALEPADLAQRWNRSGRTISCARSARPNNSTEPRDLHGLSGQSVAAVARPATRRAGEGRRRHHPPRAGAGTGAGHQLGPREIQRRLVERDRCLLCAPAADLLPRHQRRKAGRLRLP